MQNNVLTLSIYLTDDLTFPYNYDNIKTNQPDFNLVRHFSSSTLNSILNL